MFQDSPSASKVFWPVTGWQRRPDPKGPTGVPCNTFEKTVPSFCFKNVVPKFMNTKIMSNQVYYVLARVGADSIGLYVESPDFDSAYDVAEEAHCAELQRPVHRPGCSIDRCRQTGARNSLTGNTQRNGGIGGSSCSSSKALRI